MVAGGQKRPIGENQEGGESWTIEIHSRKGGKARNRKERCRNWKKSRQRNLSKKGSRDETNGKLNRRAVITPSFYDWGLNPYMRRACRRMGKCEKKQEGTNRRGDRSGQGRSEELLKEI